LALVVCVAIFGLMPAVGAYSFHNLSPRDIPAMELRIGWDQAGVLDSIRNGNLRTLSPANLTGIIAFPSFHAAGATLMAWAVRRLPVVGLLSLIWNGAIIATTPLIGSHYFCDVIAGIVVAAVAILASQPDRATGLTVQHRAF
jgi:membrane-associated phospholipid phosphatase